MHTTRPRGSAARRPLALVSLVAAVALPLAACGTPAGSDEDTSAPEETTTEAAAATEEAASVPRLVITYDGGLQVLDATTLEVVSDIPMDGFVRVNSGGDGRHAFVTTTGGFQLLDLGVWAEPHGDHNHYYSADPALLDVLYAADTPGHVVNHHGHTVLFDDGTGDVTVLETSEIADPDHAVVDEYTTPAAHHGVAIELEDGSLLVTEGDEDARTGAVALDAERTELAASDECPGVHGEAATDSDHVAFGCEDGVLLYTDGAFTKVTAPDAYGRIGNLFAVEGSEVVLGDYDVDPDTTPMTNVSLIDTETGDLSVVALPTEYGYRGLARDDEGHALVLGTDGALHVLDPASGEIESSIPVVDAWEVPEDWQAPRPAVFFLEGSAYVTDPANNGLYGVDVESGEIWVETTLDVAANEISGASGDVVEGVSAEHGGDDHDHAGEDHEDHDH